MITAPLTVAAARVMKWRRGGWIPSLKWSGSATKCTMENMKIGEQLQAEEHFHSAMYPTVFA